MLILREKAKRGKENVNTLLLQEKAKRNGALRLSRFFVRILPDQREVWRL